MSSSQSKCLSTANASDAAPKKETPPDAIGGVKVSRVPAGKPIVLSSHRYEKLINNATDIDAKNKAILEEKNNQLETLKAGNEAIVANFKENMQRTQEQKLQQIKDELEKKTQFARESYEQTKENEALKRREKIAKAQQLVEKLKPGPRELHTAVLQSEVLRARNIQIEINEEFKRNVYKQEIETKNRCEGQSMTWIHDEQKRIAERQKKDNDYKRELLQTINSNQRHKAEQKNKLLKEQVAEREQVDVEVKAQIEKEKAIMEKKKETLRKNALEAMKMVEQRRMRENLCSNLEDRLCSVYNTGKRQMNDLLTDQNNQLAANRQHRIEDEVRKLTAIDDKVQAVESERVRRDITTMQIKFTAEEQEKVRKDKAAKQARIEAYLREMQEQKQAKHRAEEEKRFEMALRFKNNQVNCIFAENERQAQIAHANNVRAYLTKQIEENERVKATQKSASMPCNDDVLDREHKFFFEYAHELMDDAYKKGRPIYPFVKAVQEYKKANTIGCERKVPRHLETNISLGQCQPCPKDAKKKDLQANGGNRKEHPETNGALESILKDCLKIDEIIVKSYNDEKKDNSKDDGDEKKNKDCVSVSSSVKLRYSKQDLKKFNQYAAPSCH